MLTPDDLRNENEPQTTMFISQKVVAARLGKHPDTISAWARRGFIGQKIGNRYHITEAEVARLENPPPSNPVKPRQMPGIPRRVK